MDRISNTSRAATEIDRQVGANVRALRNARGMTLAELGTELGISHQHLQKYETSANRISAGMLLLIAQALRVPVVTLYGPAADESDTEDEAAATLRGLLREMAGLCLDAERLLAPGGHAERGLARRAQPLPATITSLRSVGGAS